MVANQQSIINESALTAIKKLAHDIRSPLASLKMRIEFSTELPQALQSFIIYQLNRMSGILNNAHQKYDTEKLCVAKCKERVAVAKIITAIIAEKNVEHGNKRVQFKSNFAEDGELATIKINQSDLERMLSNMINNAVEACEGIDGMVGIKLSKSDNSVRIAITDNGKGLPARVIQKIKENEIVTHGKENGQGFGFQHIRETLAEVGGELLIESNPSQLTTITLVFPRIE